jgi:tetratricopeptide (TPR) repeat protein
VDLSDEALSLMRAAAQLQKQNRPEEAIAAYRAILDRWPGLADAWYNLGVVQRRTMRVAEALVSYQRALERNIDRPEEVCLNRSVIYSDFMRDPDAAARELKIALRVNPAYTPAMLNLANLHEDLGQRNEAIALYENILALQPQHFEALARRANATALNDIDVRLVERVQVAVSAATDDAGRASLGFALGRLLDAQARYPEAFAAYAAANQAGLAGAQQLGLAYGRAEQQDFVDRAIALEPLPPARRSPAAPQPVFIVGMFRSGSTLAEQLLSYLPGVAAGGELDFLPRLISTELMPYFEAQRALDPEALDGIAARYGAALRAVSPTATYVTDKRPDNFLFLGLIKRIFPGAKIVHTTRNPLDNCLSIFFLHLDVRMTYALDLMDTAHFYREYRRLMAHWKSQFGDDMFDLNYDELVRNPTATFGGLCAFLGLEWDGRLPQIPAARAPVKTASVWQVREPLYTTSSGRAAHYPRELAALKTYLADLP